GLCTTTTRLSSLPNRLSKVSNFLSLGSSTLKKPVCVKSVFSRAIPGVKTTSSDNPRRSVRMGCDSIKPPSQWLNRVKRSSSSWDMFGGGSEMTSQVEVHVVCASKIGEGVGDRGFGNDEHEAADSRRPVVTQRLFERSVEHGLVPSLDIIHD